MFGEKTLKRAKIIVTEEASDQYKIVSNEIGKLADLTRTSWSLTGTELFDKVRKISFLEGTVIGAAITSGILCTGYVVYKIKSKKKKNDITEVTIIEES